jgi:hypothetical protein
MRLLYINDLRAVSQYEERVMSTKKDAVPKIGKATKVLSSS